MTTVRTSDDPAAGGAQQLPDLGGARRADGRAEDALPRVELDELHTLQNLVALLDAPVRLALQDNSARPQREHLRRQVTCLHRTPRNLERLSLRKGGPPPKHVSDVKIRRVTQPFRGTQRHNAWAERAYQSPFVSFSQPFAHEVLNREDDHHDN